MYFGVLVLMGRRAFEEKIEESQLEKMTGLKTVVFLESLLTSEQTVSPFAQGKNYL